MITKESILEEYNSDNRYLFRSHRWEYVGGIGMFDKHIMPPLAKKFYNIWKGQGSRCGNPSYHAYKKYGGSGVRRIYSSRAFICWCLNEILKRDVWYEVTIARFRDSGDYAFKNIKIIEKSENSAEITTTKLKRKTAIKNSRETRYKIAKGGRKIVLAIKTAVELLEEDIKNLPCQESSRAIASLNKALVCLEKIEKKRESRGLSKA